MRVIEGDEHSLDKASFWARQAIKEKRRRAPHSKTWRKLVTH